MSVRSVHVTSGISPHPKQRAFLDSPARFCLAFAGSQSGKTIAAAAKVLMRILTDLARPGPPKRLYWVVDPTYELAKFPQAYLVHYAKQWGVKFKLTAWIGGAGVFASMHIFAHGGHAVIEFKSAERPDRLVSASLQGIWVNEAARLKDDAWSGNLRSRLIATGGWAIFDSTPMGENWVYNEIYLPGLRADNDVWGDYEADKVNKEFETFTWESADNPAVDRAMLEHARRTMPDWAFAREWKGNPHHFAGQLFPHWLDAKNVMRIEHTDYPELEIGLDFGFGPGHPFVIIVAGVDFTHRRFGVIHEEVHEGLLFDDQVALFARVCRNFPRVEHAVGDSADPGMLALLRARRPDDVNVAIRPALKMGVREGAAAQGELIGDGNYLVHPSCKQTIRQHKSARWKPLNVGKPYGPVAEEPLRKDDDTVAACRYIVHPRLPRTTRPQAKAA